MTGKWTNRIVHQNTKIISFILYSFFFLSPLSIMAVAWYWKSVFPLFVITFISLCAIKKGFSLISPFIVKNDILPIEKYATIISLQSIASGVGKFLGSHILEKVKLRTMVISMSFLICMLLFLLYQSFYFEQNNFICILVLWNTICFCNSVIWNYGSLLTRHILPPEGTSFLTLWNHFRSPGNVLVLHLLFRTFWCVVGQLPHFSSL